MDIKEMKLNDTVYTILKWLCLVVLPSLGALYAGLAACWGWPYAEEIPTTIMLVEAFLGAILGVSTAQYNKTNK